MIVVGLTGGMGQGKSTVGEMLRRMAEVDYKADLENSHAITVVLNAWTMQWPKPLVLAENQDVVDLANQLIDFLPPLISEFAHKAVPSGALRIEKTDASKQLHNRLITYLETWLALSENERVIQLPLPITPENKGLHRKLFQWLGGVTVAVVSPTIWSDLLDARIKTLAERGYRLVTVGGIRYEHDAAMIRANKGVIVRVVRPGVATSSDVTEQQTVEPDIIIQNDGSLEELHRKAEVLWQQLQAKQAN